MRGGGGDLVLGTSRLITALRRRHRLIGRLLQILPTLLLIALAVFLLVRLLPGDPATALLGIHATPELIARLHEQLGFDQPV